MPTRSSSNRLPVASAFLALTSAFVLALSLPSIDTAAAATRHGHHVHRAHRDHRVHRSAVRRLCAARAARVRHRAARSAAARRCIDAHIALHRGKSGIEASRTYRKVPKTVVSPTGSSTPSSTSSSTSSTTASTASGFQPSPTSAPGTGTGWDGFGGLSLPGADWRPYASSSPFNQSTEGVAVASDSAQVVKKVLGWGLPGNLVAGVAETSEDWSHPTFFAEPNDPIYTLHATEPWGVSQINGMQIPIPEDARPAAGSDGHMTVVTPEGWEYDFWETQLPPKGGGTLTFGWGGRTRIDGNGLGSAGTAAGFGNLAGIIRAPELAAGHINHALFIVLKCATTETSFGNGTIAGKGTSSYVYPASDGGASCPSGEADAPPLGTRFMLAMSNAQIQALAVPQWKKTILTALSEYGGYVGDTGGPGFAFEFESSTAYTALGLPDPLVEFAKANGVPESGGHYIFNVASGVEWEKYLRVLVPPSQ